MAHAHHHHPGDNYYLDQLCTLAVAGLLGGIAFVIWKVNLLMNFNILVEQFNLWVLLGGTALLGLVVVRGISLWSEVGKRKAVNGHEHSDDHDHAHTHDHTCDHGHACGHEHDHAHDHGHAHDHADHHHGHAHDHGHEHGFAPWRYAVLLLPLMLSLLLLYYHFNKLVLVYSADRLLRDKPLGKQIVDEDKQVAEKAGEWTLGFKELTEASADPAKRADYEGRIAVQSGLFAPLNEKQFTLFRLKITCCSSDAIPLSVRIIAPENLNRLNIKPGTGVVTKGQIQFRQVVGKDEFVPVIVVKSMADIQAKDLGNDIFIK